MIYLVLLVCILVLIRLPVMRSKLLRSYVVYGNISQNTYFRKLDLYSTIKDVSYIVIVLCLIILIIQS